MSEYTDRIKAICGGSLLGLWTCDDVSGNVADSSGNGRTLTATALTYGNAGIGDGGTSLGFNGTSSQGQATAAWFSGTEGTLAVWAKVSALADWTDGNYHYVYNMYVDGNNRLLLRKNSGSNYLEFFNYFGGVAHNVSILRTYTTWFHMAVTWKTGGNVVVYENGAAILTTALAGTWAGTPTFYLGAGPSFNWKGTLDAVTKANRALTADQVNLLARVTVPTLTLTGEITTAISREGKL